MSFRDVMAQGLARLTLLVSGDSRALKKGKKVFDDDIDTYSGSTFGITHFSGTESYLQAYTTNPWINGAIKARCDATASAGLTFGRPERRKNNATGKVETVVEPVEPREGSLPKIFANPNPFMTAFDMWEWIAAFMLLDGNAYLAFDPGSKELWPMVPDKVSILPSTTEFIASYVYTVNGRPHYIEPENVFHFKRFNPRNSFYGMGDIEALFFDLNLDKKTKKYLDGFFSRGARMSGVIEVEEEVTSMERKRIAAQFESKYAGVENMHKVAFLAEGMKWVQTGMTNQQLQLPELALLSRDSVMAIFRTPPALLGRWEQARFSNAREQVRLFYESVQIPFWRKISQTVSNHQRCRAAGLVSDFDTTSIPALRESDNEKAERGRLLIQSGQMTINEVRAMLWGMAPVEGGDQIIIPKTGRNEDAGNNDPKADGDKKGQDKKADEQADEEMKAAVRIMALALKAVRDAGPKLRHPELSHMINSMSKEELSSILEDKEAEELESHLAASA